RYGERTASARRTKTRIDLVQPTVGAKVGHPLDNALPQLAEKVVIAGDLDAGASRGMGLTIRLVEKHQIEVAVVVWLATAELPQGQHDELCGLADPLRVGMPLPPGGQLPFGDRHAAGLANAWLTPLLHEPRHFGIGYLS